MKIFCIEIFESPVRITECGHNYCERCLIYYARGSSAWTCPKCRLEHQTNPDELTRNYFVEQAVESYNSSSKKALTDNDYCDRHPTRQIEFSKYLY